MKAIPESWQTFFDIVKDRQMSSLGLACAVAGCSKALPRAFKTLGYIEEKIDETANYIYVGPDDPDWNKVRLINRVRRKLQAAQPVNEFSSLTDQELWNELKRRGWEGKITMATKKEMQ